ncbi:MAG TPA: hypothetical protein VIC84_23675 [Blastocatellia bacterium]|jgi:hypothetical protein
MNLKQRLGKIEETLRALSNCELCAHLDAVTDEWNAKLISLGAEAVTPLADEVINLKCPWCLRPYQMYSPGYGPAEREAERRINAEEIECCRTDREPSQEILDLCAWVIGRRREIGIEEYGADLYRRLNESGGYSEWERGFLEEYSNESQGSNWTN